VAEDRGGRRWQAKMVTLLQRPRIINKIIEVELFKGAENGQ
jgi:hypothetical protein